MQLISGKKHWKHVSVQKVVSLSLSTCCDVACLTFQFSHITTGSFGRHQCLEECNITFSQMKKFSILHGKCGDVFQMWWVSGFVFFWDNVNNLKYAWIILLQMTFFNFQRYNGYSIREVGKCTSYWCQMFSGLSHRMYGRRLSASNRQTQRSAFSVIAELLLPAALRAAQICRYLVYSEADFDVFRPAGATRCTENEIGYLLTELFEK